MSLLTPTRHLLATVLTVACALTGTACSGRAGSNATPATPPEAPAADRPVVYLTREISPDALVRIYHALGRKAEGRVAVKVSTGEAGNDNYLKPALIGALVAEVDGTVVECNTAYGGRRNTTEAHWQTIRDHGFIPAFTVDLMDEEGDMEIPVADTTHLRCDIVGSHLARYDFMVNLAHFKGHPMGGLGGVIKNSSIGVASANGKANIHTAGYQQTVEGMWSHVDDQDGFLESMAAAAQAVHHYFGDGERIVYIAVMNNMSIDCDCVATPEPVRLKDYGILASLDPVALDQACADIIMGMTPDADNDNRPMVERIRRQHGLHTLEWAEHIGLGSRSYQLSSIDR